MKDIERVLVTYNIRGELNRNFIVSTSIANGGAFNTEVTLSENFATGSGILKVSKKRNINYKNLFCVSWVYNWFR